MGRPVGALVFWSEKKKRRLSADGSSGGRMELASETYPLSSTGPRRTVFRIGTAQLGDGWKGGTAVPDSLSSRRPSSSPPRSSRICLAHPSLELLPPPLRDASRKPTTAPRAENSKASSSTPANRCGKRRGRGSGTGDSPLVAFVSIRAGWAPTSEVDGESAWKAG